MPNLAIELSETYDSISRPVVLSVVRGLIDRLALPVGTKVQYNGAIDSPTQPGSTLSERDIDPPAQFPFTSKVAISVNEQFLEDYVLTTAVRKKENIAVFVDQALDVYMKPVYMSTQMTVSVRYRAPDRNSALRWQNELRRRASQGQVEMLFQASYHYPIPKEFLVILMQIFDQRESVAGYGEDARTYLKEHFTDRARAITTLTGTHPEITIGEHQVGIVGWFDFVAIPDNPEPQDKGGAWECGFDFTFNYDKVTAMVMQYPIIVHNQLLPAWLVPTERPYELSQHFRAPSWSRWLTDSFTPLYAPSKGLTGYVVPEYDDWLPNNVAPRTASLFTSLLGVDVDDPKAVLSLRELGEYKLSDNILHFLETEFRHITLRRGSVFYISLFEGHRNLDDDILIVTPDLEVRSRHDLDPRKQYHFRLALYFDLASLSKPAIDRLRKDPPALIDIIDALDPIGDPQNPGRGTGGGQLSVPIVNTPTYPRLKDELEVIGGGKQVTQDSLDKVIDKLTKDQSVIGPDGNPVGNTRYPVRGVTDLKMRTVLSASVIVHKVSNDNADYQSQHTEAAQQAARAATDYRKTPQRGDGGHETDTGVESTEVRRGVTMAGDLLPTGPR